LERSLWKAAAVRPTKPWYVATHAVMPPTLMRASTDEAYALTDRATFLRLQKQLKLRVIAQGGDRLADPYSVIVVAHPDARTACARKLADYLDSPGSQAIINSFGVTQWGQALYAGAAPTP
ncbi:MAG: tungsten ABC transporter substrate-binding protein, partial [Sporichthyaceae bacterium]